MKAFTALAGEFRGFVRSNRFQIIAATASIAIFVTVWHIVSWYLVYSDASIAEFVPSPLTVFETLVESFVVEVPGMDITMGAMVVASLKRVVAGFFLALIVAVPMGLLMATSKIADHLGKPIVEMFRPIPPVAWIPIFLVVFKNVWGPVAIVFLGIFFPILLSVMFGVRRTDPALIDAARTLGASNRDVFSKVILPFTIPYIMTGVKVGLGIGWMCIVAAEMLPVLGGGVGNALWTSAQSYSRYDVTYACMIVIGILSILTTGVAGFIERRFYRWMEMQ